MTQVTPQERWFLVNQLLTLTEKEVKHLKLTTTRINALEPDLKWVESLEERIEYAEMLDAFVSRFSRLQDTLGDKLLPALLQVTLEKTGSQLVNFDQDLAFVDQAIYRFSKLQDCMGVSCLSLIY